MDYKRKGNFEGFASLAILTNIITRNNIAVILIFGTALIHCVIS